MTAQRDARSIYRKSTEAEVETSASSGVTFELLRQREERFALVIAGANDGLWDWDMRSGRVYRSARLQEILGLDSTARDASPEEWLGLIHPADRTRYRECFLDYLRGAAERFECKYRLRDATGAYRWVSDHAKGLRDETGRLYRIAGSSRDVTEEARAEEALKRSEQRFRDVAEVAADLIWEFDSEFRFTYLSGAGRDWSHVPDQDVLGTTRWESAGVDPSKDAHWARHKADLEAHRPFRHFRYSVKNWRGETRYFRASGVPIFDENGAFAGYRGTETNETDAVTALKRAQQAEDLLRNAIESISEGFVIYDKDDCLVMCNQAYRDKYPESREYMKTGATFEDVLRGGLAKGQYVEAVGREGEWLEERLRQHREASGSVEQRLKDGRHILISERRMPDGGIAGLRLDVTALRQAKAAQQESEARLSGVADSIPGVIFRLWLKPDGKVSIIYFNESARALFGEGAQGVVHEGNALPPGLHPDDADSFLKIMHRSATDLSVMQVEVKVVTPGGEIRWLDSRSRPRRLEDGTVQWDGIALDITDRKAAEAKHDRLAYFDPLTGLPNRNLFMDRLGQAVAPVERTGVGGAVLAIDLDRFREVYDSWGAATADAVLMETAVRLGNALRPTDTVARIGDNQFGILLVGIAKKADTAIPVAKLMRLFETPFRPGDRDVRVGASVGVSVYPDDSTDIQALVQNAQTALHKAKSEGPGHYQFYAQAMTKEAIRRSSIEVELHRAIHSNELEVFYQPKIRPTGEIVGMEALVRWRHPERGLILPGTFIPIAEQSDLIDAIGEFVLRTACEQNRAWQKRGLPALPVSINLSKVQMRDARLIDRIAEILGSTGLSPECLELEITESAILQRLDVVSALMQALRGIGIRFAIDDFGVEHSALNQLIELPVDALKVDNSFVSKMTTDNRYAAIVQAIIMMAHTLGYKAIAEGVETEEQTHFLQAYGCDEMQGFLYSPAVSATEFEALLTQGRLAPIKLEIGVIR